MKHESFYVSGECCVPELGVYAGWMALEGTFAAHQSHCEQHNDIAVAVSGECFLEPSYRSQLVGSSDPKGSKDALWLARLYDKEGNRFFSQLNGLFSGLVVDKRRRSAFLFNDRYGLERIYFYEAKDGTYFASEAKALLRVLPELRAFDPEGVAQFLTFGCNLEWRTLFRGVRVLPGGSLWSFDGHTCKKDRYFVPAEYEKQPMLTEETFESQFESAFERVLPRYFESDSRIGISLTGGLDTRMIMAWRSKPKQKPVCYTFAGLKGETLDVRIAGRVATECGLEHHLLRIRPDFLADFRSHADKTVSITDGCCSVLGSHEIYLNAQARQFGRTRLTGNFGSEILRSMSTFKPVRLEPELFNSDLRGSMLATAEPVIAPHEHPVTFAAFREIPWNLFGTLAAGRSQLSFRSPYLDNELVALAFQAPQNSRRSPLPALRLVKSGDPVLGAIPTDRGIVGGGSRVIGGFRRLFSEITFKLDYYYSEGLPSLLTPLDPFLKHLNSGSGILGLHKFLLYRRWFQKELAAYANEVVTDPQTLRSSLWNPGFVRHMASDHQNGKKNYLRELNAVLTLEAVDRLILRSGSALP